MRGHRVPLLVSVALAGTTLLTATALAAVKQQGRPPAGRVEMAAGLTSSVTQNGIEVRAAAGTARVAAGAVVPVMVSVCAERSQPAVVDLEAYDPRGHRVFQRYWAEQHLTAGRTTTWTVPWTLPSAPGRYRLAVGVFSAGWGSLLAWNNQAAFVV